MEDSDLAVPASSSKQALVLPNADVCNTLLFNLQRHLQGELLSRQVQEEAVHLVVSSCTDTTCNSFIIAVRIFCSSLSALCAKPNDQLLMAADSLVRRICVGICSIVCKATSACSHTCSHQSRHHSHLLSICARSMCAQASTVMYRSSRWFGPVHRQICV